MGKTRILFVSQEITPYLPESEMSIIGRNLPQGIQEKDREIRTFMPRYGSVNERRNQLHEVIRLSGMNLIIDDSDHPLIIKVASIQQARMQVYFIDNEEYFQRKHVLTDEKGKFFKDNDERAIFFCRGVLETVKKLGWAPDIVHCHGWITGILPLYIKKSLQDDPLFADAKVIYSVYDDDFKGSLHKDFTKKIKYDGIVDADMELLSNPTYVNISKLALSYSDAVIIGSSAINPEIETYISTLDKPVLGHQSLENYIDAYADFYDEVLEGNAVLVE